ncbi:MAG: DNA repair protein RecN [Lachnospiraceae bacterium]
MLLNIHVKNLALIDEIEVDFREHLNIMTGETGAGKSIVIGSVAAALGGRISRDRLRDENQDGLIELLFQVNDERVSQWLYEHEIEPLEDGQVLITRKISKTRSISRINGETVTAAQVKELSAYLIDIHGQHEHQSLLHSAKHLDILDRYAGSELASWKQTVRECYQTYAMLRKELNQQEMSEEERIRTVGFLEYEIGEIESAHLIPKEDEEWNRRYQLMKHSKGIVEALDEVHGYMSYDEPQSVGSQIGYALKSVQHVMHLDAPIAGFYEELQTVDSLLNDLNREISDYMQEMTFDACEFAEVEERLNTIHTLQSKYGNTIEAVLDRLAEKKEQLQKLEDYESYRTNLYKRYEKASQELMDACEELSCLRQQAAQTLTEAIRQALIDLNFLDVMFVMDFSRKKEPTANGYDDAVFLISTNPGMAPRPLADIASGGELSRIMLAIKSVLADIDQIDTLIFDEIDTGISGRTAQKVSEKLDVLGRTHQVICITHLAQIAAMADAHYCIAKSVENQSTTTQITELNEEESIQELARITGGVSITETVLQNAREMKELARRTKCN